MLVCDPTLVKARINKNTHFNAIQQRTKLRTDKRGTSVRGVYVKPNVVLGTFAYKQAIEISYSLIAMRHANLANELRIVLW